MTKEEMIAAVGKVIADNWPAAATVPVPAPTVAIDPADILTHASAVIPFAQQSGYRVQVFGSSRPAEEIPEDGLKSTQLSNGDSLRFGKVQDPANRARSALLFQVHKNDKTTSGGKRAELTAKETGIEHDKLYWVAFGLYVYDWGTLSQSDDALFGAQLHQGNENISVGGPAFSLYTQQEGRHFRVRVRYSENANPSNSNAKKVEFADLPMPFGRWADFVFKFKQSTSGKGLLQVWMDGAQIVEYQGSLGFNSGGKDYMKFGYYNWSANSMNSSPRKLLLRSPVTVADPAGKYSQEVLRSFVNKE